MKAYVSAHKKIILTSLTIIIAFIGVGIYFVNDYLNKRYDFSYVERVETESKNTVAVKGVAVNVNSENIKIEDLLAESNKKRSESSVSALSLNENLNNSAKLKCEDMIKKNYWSHESPDGNEPWVFFDSAGYKYSKAGENLAFGYWNGSSVVNAWMTSPEHKVNLLDSSFDEVGFGICESSDFANNGKEVIVVQHLGSRIKKSTSNTSRQATPAYEYKPYVAGVCTKTPISRGTDIKYADYMYEDEEQRYTGWDGYLETCTADSTGYKRPDFSSPPYNDTLYKGTKKRASNTPSSGYTYTQAYQLATNNCSALGTGNSSAFDVCVDAYMTQFGY